ncbi:(d)CMP kinase [Candidatus Nephthysia bennettiae]|uniref:Cytidylate kinase n=1 Tax=Candidatus Nephthysia bennettiae TaxID=3127016 RepID=A0A934KEH5_9BACT|nr:(d)CMP kinase [Candidatus Dormibacteraeota bacterium]MBJ7611184.1 (d)CMP kinase [Candidatus Dormibacteraeota bacterium]
MIIAIDGPAGSGKSAVGRRVAEALGLPFVDSGLMYRAIALLALERGVELTDGSALTRLAGSVKLRVDGRRLWIDQDEYTNLVYGPELSEGASLVGKIAGVRLALVAQQRALGRQGVVMAGRDIGTVVFPDTRFKFFLTAGVEERARRRAAQIEARGEVPDPARLKREVEERDRRDSQRSVAPMHPADDAIVVETDDLDLDAVVAEVLRSIREAA